jgi:hypothetical protein
MQWVSLAKLKQTEAQPRFYYGKRARTKYRLITKNKKRKHLIVNHTCIFNAETEGLFR